MITKEQPRTFLIRSLNRLYQIAFLLSFFSAFTACSLLPNLDGTNAESSDQKAISEPTPKKTTTFSKPFEEDTLLNLLLGEIAIYDHDINTAASQYKNEALKTKDKAVTMRAAKLARYNKNLNDSLLLAEQWHTLDPLDKAATENLADLYSRTNRPLDALKILANTFLNSESNIDNLNFSLLRNSKFSTDKNNDANNTLQKVIDQLEALDGQREHKNFTLILTQALLLKNNNENEKALAKLNILESFGSDPIRLSLIKSELLAELDRDQEAAKILKKAIKKNPENRKLRIEYAKKLIKTNLSASEKEYARLLEETPNELSLVMSHGLVAAENGNYQEAERSLKHLLSLQKETDFAHYHLGMIALEQEDPEKALNYFKQVGESKFLRDSARQIMAIYENKNKSKSAVEYLQKQRLLYPNMAEIFWIYESYVYRDLKQYTQAHNILSEAIEKMPYSNTLKVERSHISEKLGNISLTIKDLRDVLANDPNNVFALNALGYTLANHTDKFDEALNLVQKAINILPDNAAIRDSLGWIQFKTGNYEEAEKNLKMAFTQMEDDEIAAHLIELYWTIQQKGKAKEIYKTMLKKDTEIPLTNATIKRLNIKF